MARRGDQQVLEPAEHVGPDRLLLERPDQIGGDQLLRRHGEMVGPEQGPALFEALVRGGSEPDPRQEIRPGALADHPSRLDDRIALRVPGHLGVAPLLHEVAVLGEALGGRLRIGLGLRGAPGIDLGDQIGSGIAARPGDFTRLRAHAEPRDGDGAPEFLCEILCHDHPTRSPPPSVEIVPMSDAPSSLAAPKRFYTTVTVESGAIKLDGRAARTPKGAPLALPTVALAELVAEEWRGQGASIVYAAMPATRLAHTAIDAIADAREATVDSIVRFAASDLLCYFADHPASLVARQEATWRPLIAWARDAHGLAFKTTPGIVHRAQPPETLARVKALVRDGRRLHPRRPRLRRRPVRLGDTGRGVTRRPHRRRPSHRRRPPR